jgi:hypothetical protein
MKKKNECFNHYIYELVDFRGRWIFCRKLIFTEGILPNTNFAERNFAEYEFRGKKCMAEKEFELNIIATILGIVFQVTDYLLHYQVSSLRSRLNPSEWVTGKGRSDSSPHSSPSPSLSPSAVFFWCFTRYCLCCMHDAKVMINIMYWSKKKRKLYDLVNCMFSTCAYIKERRRCREVCGLAVWVEYLCALVWVKTATYSMFSIGVVKKWE